MQSLRCIFSGRQRSTTPSYNGASMHELREFATAPTEALGRQGAACCSAAFKAIPFWGHQSVGGDS
jgi:hypothetical protein